MMHTKILQHGSLTFLLIASMIVAAFPAPAASSPSGAETLAEMEAFFDGVMVARMNADHLPGAVVMVVKNGQVFFIKTRIYSYCSIENTPSQGVMQKIGITFMKTYTQRDRELVVYSKDL